MANTGKSELPPAAKAEYRHLVRSLTALSADERQFFMLSPNETAALLNVSIGTLDRARLKRRQATEQGLAISPTSLASLPFSQPEKEGNVRYFLKHAFEYLKRLIKAAEMDEPAASVDSGMTGVQRWMAIASPSDTWPFSIQPDGRPMDLMTAVSEKCLSDNAERLTLREFGSRLADAAAASYARDEGKEIGYALSSLVERADEPGDRWARSGGPI